MTSCSKVEEETNKEDDRQENSLREIEKTLSALEAIPIHLNWGQIFSFSNQTRQHMVATLQHPEIYVDKVKGVAETSSVPKILRPW